MNFRFSSLVVGAAVLLGGNAAAAVPANPAPVSGVQAAPLGANAAASQVLVPAGTTIVVATKHGYTSYGASSGTKVLYEVEQDVVVNGYLVAKAGDAAEGSILNAHQGVNNLISVEAANLRVSVEKVFTYCGDTLDMDFQRSEFRQRQGFLGSHKDVEIIKGQKYQVPTERAARVCATKTDEQAAAIPADALKGDQ